MAADEEVAQELGEVPDWVEDADATQDISGEELFDPPLPDAVVSEWEHTGKRGQPARTDVVVQSSEVKDFPGLADRHKYRYRRGQTVGVPGRPTNQARAACVLAFAERIPLLCKIADGKVVRSWQMLTKEGKVVTLRERPALKERIEAIKLLGHFGQVASSTLFPDDALDPDAAALANAAIAGATGALAALAARLAESGRAPDEVVGGSETESDYSSG